MKTAIVTYNPLAGIPTGPCSWGGSEYLILPETFSENGRKAPELVRPDDPNWKTLLSYRNELARIVVFAGKKDSGALEIIRLVMDTFKDQLDMLYFVFCDHELDEKKALVHELGGTESNYMCFSDHHTRCNESVILKGLMFEGASTPFQTHALCSHA